MDGYEDLGLRGGIWRGQIARTKAPGRILLVHMGEVLDEAEVAPRAEGQWQVTVRLPADRLTDGAATFSLHEDTGQGGEPLQPGSVTLATLPLIAGKALHRDLRAELTLLRAELDLLKREFRRHAADVVHGGRAEVQQAAPRQPEDGDRRAVPETTAATPVPPTDAPLDTSPPDK